jgi:hypothetical protein
MELVEAVELYQATQASEGLDSVESQFEHYAEALALLLNLNGPVWQRVIRNIGR